MPPDQPPVADPQASENVRLWDAQRAQKGWWHTFELPDGSVIEGVASLAGLKNRIAQFPIPADLRGKRVLDIGCWDGWFSFEMERRGAEVMAIDNWDNQRFHYMHHLLGSRVDYRIMDIYELHPDKIGRFDIVLFMGVLYHLKHPLLALEKVCALTTDLAAVDSYYAPNLESGTLMEFYEIDELGGQFDNWVGPSIDCLLAFCRTAGFARVELRSILEHSACMACYRHWEPAPETGGPAPELLSALHHTNFGLNFNTARDEYICCWFRSPHADLRRPDIDIEVAGYGSRATALKVLDGGIWHACAKLPPGLTRGWQEVRLRARGSSWSNAVRIAIDIEPVASAITVAGVYDARLWTQGQVARGPEAVASLWVRGLPENADRHNVRVMLGARRLMLDYVASPSGDEACQLNAMIPADMAPGDYALTVAVGSTVSAPVNLRLT